MSFQQSDVDKWLADNPDLARKNLVIAPRPGNQQTSNDVPPCQGSVLKSVDKSKSSDNKYKQQLELYFLSLGLDVVHEYKFHEKRRWKFDAALPAIKVAVEYEGLPLQVEKSRHTTIAGFAGDCEKYSEAAILGWCVIRVNALSIDSGLALDLIRRAVDARRMGIEEVASKRRQGNVCDL